MKLEKFSTPYIPAPPSPRPSLPVLASGLSAVLYFVECQYDKASAAGSMGSDGHQTSGSAIYRRPVTSRSA